MLTQEFSPYLMEQKGELLERERLNQIFENAMSASLITITAGSGYGKTQGTSMYLKKKNARIVWLALSSLDNLPSRFWESFCNSFSMDNPDFGYEIYNLGFPYTDRSFNEFMRRFAQEVYIGRQMILVIDDLHTIHEKAIFVFLRNLIQLKLENLNFVALSRYPVDFLLNIDKTLINTCEITEEDLKFTRLEVRELLISHQITAAESVLDSLMEHTEGWTLAVTLITWSLKHGNALDENMLAEITPYIYSLIEQEIFSKYPPDLQRLLIKASLLDEITIPLIDALISHERKNDLLQIYSANMFIHYDRYLGVCSFHYLFLNFLTEKQGLIPQKEIDDLYMRAGDWHFKNNHRIDAIEYYQRCHDEKKIWQAILFDKPMIFSEEDANYFIRQLESFSPEFIDQQPLSQLIHAGLLLNNARFKDAELLLIKFVQKLKKYPKAQKTDALLGEAYAFLGLCHIKNMDDKCRDYFHLAAAYLPQGSRLIDHSACTHDNRNILHLEDPSAGSVDRIAALHREASADIIQVLNKGCIGLDHLALCECAFFRGQLTQAKQLAQKTMETAMTGLQLDIYFNACYLLLRSYCAGGNYQKCITTLETMQAVRQKYPDHMPDLSIYDLAFSWFYIKLGTYDQIPPYLLDSSISETMPAPIYRERDRLIKAYYLLSQKQYSELAGYLDQLETYYIGIHSTIPLLSTHIMKAVAAYYLGEPEQCLRAFQKAYRYAYPNNLSMLFTEFGNSMRSVIDTVLRHDSSGMDREWLTKINTKATTYAKKLAALVHEYQEKHPGTAPADFNLSLRELDILRDLCQGLTREEIAVSLDISPNTVKSNLQNIYNKLGALNLADAIRIALSNHLI